MRRTMHLVPCSNADVHAAPALDQELEQAPSWQVHRRRNEEVKSAALKQCKACT